MPAEKTKRMKEKEIKLEIQNSTRVNTFPGFEVRAPDKTSLNTPPRFWSVSQYTPIVLELYSACKAGLMVVAYRSDLEESRL